MKGKTLKLACLAGLVFLLFMLPSCSLFDTVSGVWDGEINIEVNFQEYGKEDADVNIRITLSKSGNLITGSLDEADDFGAPFLSNTYEWDIPGDLSGTADGTNVTVTAESETSYININYETVTITLTATITGTIKNGVLTGTVEGEFEFSGGYTNTYDFDGTCSLNKIS